MKLVLKRTMFAKESTLGELFVDGKFFCYTIEDQVRTGEKVAGETAIPYGVYPVTITFSARFKKEMPLIDKVPGFTGIRIHAGLNEKHTEGCVLVGFSWTMVSGEPVIRPGTSRPAYDELFAKLKKEILNKQKISIEIVSQISEIVRDA